MPPASVPSEIPEGVKPPHGWSVEFSVAAEQCDSDLRAWLQDMIDEGLVKIEAEATEDEPVA